LCNWTFYVPFDYFLFFFRLFFVSKTLCWTSGFSSPKPSQAVLWPNPLILPPHSGDLPPFPLCPRPLPAFTPQILPRDPPTQKMSTGRFSCSWSLVIHTFRKVVKVAAHPSLSLAPISTFFFSSAGTTPCFFLCTVTFHRCPRSEEPEFLFRQTASFLLYLPNLLRIFSFRPRFGTKMIRPNPPSTSPRHSWLIFFPFSFAYFCRPEGKTPVLVLDAPRLQ